ncbi:MAG: type II secretion system minor pseudopilin GspJ [Sphingomonas sp.]
MKRNGFTLIEMLIALTIFGMLTAAGVALLSVSARTQETSDRLLAELGEVRRLNALLVADLGEAAARLHRDPEGRSRRAFAGAGGQAPMLMMFVRRSADDGESTGTQRVGYRLAQGQLQRIAFARVDGGGGSAAVFPLMDSVRSVRLRYRNERGEWLDAWNEPDLVRLPAAVELMVDSARHGTVRMLFIVGGAR